MLMSLEYTFSDPWFDSSISNLVFLISYFKFRISNESSMLLYCYTSILWKKLWKFCLTSLFISKESMSQIITFFVIPLIAWLLNSYYLELKSTLWARVVAFDKGYEIFCGSIIGKIQSTDFYCKTISILIKKSHK